MVKQEEAKTYNENSIEVVLNQQGGNNSSKQFDIVILLDYSLSMESEVAYISRYQANITTREREEFNFLHNRRISDENNNYAKRFKIARNLIANILDYYEKENKINKLGFIIFNHETTEVVNLNDEPRIGIDKFKAKCNTISPSGATALYDAIKYALSKLENSNNPKLIILTDGEDNSSKSCNIDELSHLTTMFGLKDTLKTCILSVLGLNDIESDLMKNFYTSKVADNLNAKFYDALSNEKFDEALKDLNEELKTYISYNEALKYVTNYTNLGMKDDIIVRVTKA